MENRISEVSRKLAARSKRLKSQTIRTHRLARAVSQNFAGSNDATTDDFQAVLLAVLLLPVPFAAVDDSRANDAEAFSSEAELEVDCHRRVPLRPT